MTLHQAVLELDADVDNDGFRETGVFEMVGNLEINQGGVVDHLLSRQFGNVNAVLTSQLGGLKEKRNSFYIDLGAGAHQFEISFLGWEGAQRKYEDATGNTVIEDVTWGDPTEPIGVANATGENAYHQMQCLMEYLRSGEYDSRDERARFRYGEYSDGTYSDDGSTGIYDDWLHVTVMRYNANRVADSPLAFDGSIALEETQDLTGPIDLIMQNQY